MGTGLAKQPPWGPAPSNSGSRASAGSSRAPGAWARRRGMASGEDSGAGEELGAVAAAELAAEMAVAEAPAAVLLSGTGRLLQLQEPVVPPATAGGAEGGAHGGWAPGGRTWDGNPSAPSLSKLQ